MVRGVVRKPAPVLAHLPNPDLTGRLYAPWRTQSLLSVNLRFNARLSAGEEPEVTVALI